MLGILQNFGSVEISKSRRFLAAGPVIAMFIFAPFAEWLNLYGIRLFGRE